MAYTRWPAGCPDIDPTGFPHTSWQSFFRESSSYEAPHVVYLPLDTHNTNTDRLHIVDVVGRSATDICTENIVAAIAD
jgi:hypothetical protein